MRDEPVLIRSRDNPHVRRLVRIATSARERRATRVAILDGLRLICAYRDSGGTAEILALSESAYADPTTRTAFETTPAGQRLILAEPLMRRISQVVTPSGILAAVRTPEPGPIPKDIGNGLLLEGVQDPGNLGSILRSAVAAGIRSVFLSRGSVFAWAPKVLRAGMGAHFLLAIHEDVSTEEIVSRATGEVIAAAPRAASSLYEVDLKGPVLWIFGNEAAGLSPQTLRHATVQIAIPMPGPVESLNIASAAAVCLFEQVRQRTVNVPVAPDGIPA